MIPQSVCWSPGGDQHSRNYQPLRSDRLTSKPCLFHLLGEELPFPHLDPGDIDMNLAELLRGLNMIRQ